MSKTLKRGRPGALTRASRQAPWAVCPEGGDGQQRQGVEAVQGTQVPRVKGEPVEGLGQGGELMVLRRSRAAG